MAELGRLSFAAIVAGLGFTLAWAVLARISPGFTIFGTNVSPYSSVAHSISGLGMGKTAAAMNTAFVATGVLLALGIVGVFSTLPGLSITNRYVIGAILLLSPVGVAGCGIFDLEHFMAHLGAFLLAMCAPIVGFAALGWYLSAGQDTARLGHMLMVASGITLVLLVAYFWTFDLEGSGRGEGIAGLVQRILVTEVLGVFAVLGWTAGHAV